MCVALGALVCLGPLRANAELVINDFLADPVGSDGGHEYVELYNSGPDPVTFDTVALQFANGAVGAEWVTRWQGAGAVTLPSGGYFLIVDRNWQDGPTGQAEVRLGLQNGPDAIRLIRGSVVLDLVGYGRLTDPDLFAGQPVPLVPGLALARRPDGHNTKDNQADFVATIPTPGAPNFALYSLVLEDYAYDPPLLSLVGEALQVSLTLRNDGTAPLPGGQCELSWPTGSVTAWWDGGDSGSVLTTVYRFGLHQRGQVPLKWRYLVPGTTDTLQLDAGTVQVGPSELQLSELMPVPTDGQGEWIELQWTGAEPANLAGYAVRDEDGPWHELPALLLQPNEFLVAAADSSNLNMWLAVNLRAGAGSCLTAETGIGRSLLSGWPSLNNTAPASRSYADRVYLANPAGVVIDAVAWGGAQNELSAQGLSLERVGPAAINPGGANWLTCTDQAGATPGCPNSVALAPSVGPLGQSLIVSPSVLDRLTGPTVVHLRFDLRPDERAWELRVYNLWGDALRDFGGDQRGPGPRDLIWDGSDDNGAAVYAGAYTAWLEVSSATGAVTRREKVRLVVR